MPATMTASNVWEVQAKIASDGGGMGFIGPKLTSRSDLTARATDVLGTASASAAGASGGAATSARAHP